MCLCSVCKNTGGSHHGAGRGDEQTVDKSRRHLCSSHSLQLVLYSLGNWLGGATEGSRTSFGVRNAQEAEVAATIRYFYPMTSKEGYFQPIEPHNLSAHIETEILSRPLEPMAIF